MTKTKAMWVQLMISMSFTDKEHARIVGEALMEHTQQPTEQDKSLTALYGPVYTEALVTAPGLDRPEVIVSWCIEDDFVGLGLIVLFTDVEHAQAVAHAMARQLNEIEAMQDVARGLFLPAYALARQREPKLDPNPVITLRTDFVP